MKTTKLYKRKLGILKVSTQGLGCMGMSEFYGAADQKESLATLNRAFELGVDFFDTADMHGFGANEELLLCSSNRGKYIMGPLHAEDFREFVSCNDLIFIDSRLCGNCDTNA
jgi:hypothetical protein